MKKKLLSVALLMGAWGAYSQVGIGTLTPNSSSQLDVVANDKGVLFPRVALESTTDATTIINGNVNSLLVFNTNTQNDITPGYYYWYVDKWMRIINHEDIAALDKNTTNVSLAVVNSELVLTDSEGNEVTIPLSEINIPTTVVKNPDGTYTYTNEEGVQMIIDATDNVINNIENILGDTNVLNELIEVLGDTYVGGNVYYDGTEFTYVDASGDTHVVNIQDIVQANETVTTIVDNGNGTFTYTNEEGTDVTFDATRAAITDNGDGTYTVVDVAGNDVIIDVPTSVVNQFEEIINGGPVIVNGNTYSSVEEYFTTLIETNETLTVLADNGDGTFTYTDEDGNDVTFDANTTAFVDNGNGTYTFTNANGDTMTINSLSDIIINFEDFVTNHEVIVNGDTYNSVEEYFTTLIETNETLTVLADNSDGTFTYTDEEGNDVTFDATRADITDNGDGTYTIVDAAGNNVVINIPGEVVNQFNEIVNAGPVVVNGDTYTTVEEYLQHVVEANETVTTIVDNGNGTFTYTNEEGTDVTFDATRAAITDNGDGTYTVVDANGNPVTIDIPASVVNQFEEIINGGPVTVNGNTYTTVEEYFQYVVNTNETVTELAYDENTNQLSFKDETGIIHNIQLNNTSLTYDETAQELIYLDSEGNTSTINLNNLVNSNINTGDLVTHADERISIVDGEDALLHDVQIDVNEANLRLQNTGGTLQVSQIQNGAPNQILVTNVGGNGVTWADPVAIAEGSLTSDDIEVTNGNNAIFKDVSLEIKDGAITTDKLADGAVTPEKMEAGADNTVMITDENGNVVWVQQTDMVTANETLTVITDNGDGTFTYTDEEGNDITFDATRSNITDNGDGTYTVVDAAGNDVTIDIPGDVVNNFNEIVNGGPVVVNGDTYNTVEEYLQNFVETNETVTTLVDNGNGTFTYTNENGDDVTFDANTVTFTNNGDNTYTFTNDNGETMTIDTNADAIAFDNTNNDFNSDNVQDALEELMNNINEGAGVELVDNNDGTVSLVAENGDVLGTVDKAELTDNNDGTYTFDNGNGTPVTIDVPASVVNQFDEIINGGPVVVNGDTYNTVEEYLQNFVETNETVTTLVDNGNGTFTYTNENSDDVTFDATRAAITDNGDGTYTVVDADGNDVIINTATTNDLRLVGNELTSTVNGVASSVTLTDANISSDKDITSNTINVTGGTGATLQDVTLEIAPGTADQILVTNAAGDGVEWVDKSAATSNELTSSGNTLTSTVNGVADTADIINSVANTVNAAGELVTTVNGVPSTAVDLTPAIQGNQLITEVEAGTGVTVTGNTTGNTTTYTVAANPAEITLGGDLSGNADDATVTGLQGTPVSATAPANGQTLVFDGTNWVPQTPSVDATNVNNAGDLTVGLALEFTGGTDGDGKLLANADIDVADGGITTDKLANRAVTAPKMSSALSTTEDAPAGAVPTADGNGNVEYKEIPRFFYMPAVIFDTSITGTGLTRDLYQDYVNQFTGGAVGSGNANYEISAGATGITPMEYTGGLIGSTGAPADVEAIYGATDMYYYITYYDTDVFANISIDANGVLTYDIIGNATETSYMNIVFVIK